MTDRESEDYTKITNIALGWT